MLLFLLHDYEIVNGVMGETVAREIMISITSTGHEHWPLRRHQAARPWQFVGPIWAHLGVLQARTAQI